MGDYKKSEINELEGFVDWKGRPSQKAHQGGIAAIFIYVTQFFDSVAFFAMIVNLVTYFNEIMHLEIAKSATTLTSFVGTTFLMALLGGLISDSYIDRYKMSFASACVELAGYIILLVQAHHESLKPPPCNPFNPTSNCEKVRGGKAAMLFTGLYLIAVGNGCLKGALLPFGADQFNDRDLKGRRKISTYFNMFLFSISAGGAFGVTVIVWVMNKKGWDIGFGICAATVFLATITFISGTTSYRNRIPQGSPLTRILQVFVAAIYNRKLALPENPNDLYELDYEEVNMDTQKLLNTEQFKFLDKAAILTETPSNYVKMEPSKWRLCSVTQVEETKIVLRMIPIFGCSIILSTGLAQLQTFSVSQGLTMDRSMGKNFDIPAASLPFIPIVFLVIIIPIYEKFFVPFARKFTGHETGITHLQRIGVGLVLSAISMTIAALVEVKRKNVARETGMVDFIPLFMPPIPISVFWLGFQYFVFGIADLFTLVGMMEFFYSEAPERMRSMATAFSYTSLSLGYFFSTILVDIVNAATRNITESRGWLRGNNLNRNHLDLFYWLLAILNVINFVNYLFWSKWYKHKPVFEKTSNV
ncbi:protein NRT1/ PTR FAMILY 4.5 [Cryptomeria japonica]|uniref:protein NRT1/ PTR FAMILY 4.5 n=1 Tax=Cryptomeria japonica TaxID=3369 RepID=UPI0027DAACDE|nr:protein NRT1/ PTR FAMILY 4.5 [Cryptomeria japonica]